MAQRSPIPTVRMTLAPLQINSNWVRNLPASLRRSEQDVRRWLASDPCFNVRAACWIFLSGLALTRDYWRAVGLYHSPTPWRQHRYAAAVSHHLRRRFGDDVFWPGDRRSHETNAMTDKSAYGDVKPFTEELF
jgi:hypothetical protein